MKKIVVLTGASGTGKTTICNYLQTEYQMEKIITHTTRPQRQGEIHGRDYYFESQASFFQHEYLESVEYDHNYYGSSKTGIQKAFEKSDWATIVLDSEGAKAYLEQLPNETIVISLTVATEGCLQGRLEKRGDSQASIEQRLASHETKRDEERCDYFASQKNCYVIVNDDWQATKQKIADLMKELQANK
ncbi:guanylate kinase [Ligilactobacillus ceti]|nr:AAA family ATPase [Ligilactobacillus ceti]